MMRTILGKTGIQVSRVGLGTSAAYDGAVCPAKLKVEDYPKLLRFAYEQGVIFWDTSLTYGTHAAVRAALKDVPRRNVTLCTKTTETGAAAAEKAVVRALEELGTGTIDIFMLQCVRSKSDLNRRQGALETLVRMKEKGFIRAVGVASHGLGALEGCLEHEEIDVILGRVNYSGELMDSRQDDLKSLLAGTPVVKKLAATLLPRSLFAALASGVQAEVASQEDQKTALDLFEKLNAAGKSVIGMKVLGEGRLAHDVARAVSFVASLSSIRSMVVGCCSEQELLDVIKAAGD